MLLEIYIYTWPADHMYDMVSYIYILNSKLKNYLLTFGIIIIWLSKIVY